MFLAAVLLLLGLAMVLFGGYALVEGASSLAKSYNIPNIVIGHTIVAFGTSSPELMVSIYGSVSGNPEITIGNVLGSNVLNILLILGVSSVIFPLAILKNTVKKEIPLALLASFIIYVMLCDSIFVGSDSEDIITRSEGITLLGFFCIFMYYLINLARNSGETEELDIKPMSRPKQVAFIVGGLLMLVLGGRLFVDNAVTLALAAGLSQTVVGLTIVALGTSLPELAISIIAAWKKQPEIAVGNVVGSNIFNSFFILGTSATIAPLPKGGIGPMEHYAHILAHILLFASGIILGKNMIKRSEGIIFLMVYLAYMFYLLNEAAQ